MRSIAVDPTNDWFCTGSADRTIKVSYPFPKLSSSFSAKRFVQIGVIKITIRWLFCIDLGSSFRQTATVFNGSYQCSKGFGGKSTPAVFVLLW